MATNGGTSSNGSGDWKGFVEVDLPKDVGLPEIESALNGVDLAGVLEELVLSGYKVTCSGKGDGEAWICSVTGKDGSGANRGYTLSTWGSSIDVAILATWYKCAVICEWGEWAADGLPWHLEL